MEIPDSIKQRKALYSLIFGFVVGLYFANYIDDRYRIDPLKNEVERLNCEIEKLNYNNNLQSNEIIKLNISSRTTPSLNYKSETLQQPLSKQNYSDSIHSKPIKSVLIDPNLDVDIPEDVESIWVFLQKDALSSNPICERLADPVVPQVFKMNLKKYISLAKEKDMSLIITAYSSKRSWNVVDQIRIGKRILKKMAPYTCNEGQINYGVEITIE